MGALRPEFRMALAVAVAGALAVVASASAATGEIRTVAGGGDGGDGIAATASKLRKPRRVAFLPGGAFLVVEFGGEATYGDGRIRRVAADGTISTVAGTGVEGFGGDGGPAADAQFNGPTDLAITDDGGYLIADEFNSRVRKVSADGTITTVAGSGAFGCQTMNATPAGSAVFSWPRSLAMYPDGSYLVLDEFCGKVHRVSQGNDGITGTSDDRVTTVAGTGGAGFSGDGGPALAAQLNNPRGVAIAKDGGFYIADSLNYRVRRVWPDGVITTVAGVGQQGASANNRPATSIALSVPRDVDEAPDGGFVIADSTGNRIRRVAPDGIITSIAGNGTFASTGDGGPASASSIAEPHGVNIASNGDLYISGAGLVDSANTNYRVRVIEKAFSLTPANLPPPPRITSGPTGNALQSDPTPTFTVSGLAGAGFPWQVRSGLTGALLPGATGTSADGTITLPALADGSWFLEVRQRSSGVSGSWTSAQFQVDATGPAAPAITTTPGPSTGEPRPTFGWVGSEGTTGFTWEVLGPGDVTVAGPVQTDSQTVHLPQALPAGAYTFRVRQADALLNPGAWASAAFTVVQATTPPGDGGGAPGGGTTGGGTPPPTPGAIPTPRPVLTPATRNARLMSPAPGTPVRTDATTLRWKVQPSARAYRVRLYRLVGTRRVLVLTSQPRGARLLVPRGRLRQGQRYVWKVWPLRPRSGRLVAPATPAGISWFRTPEAG